MKEEAKRSDMEVKIERINRINNEYEKLKTFANKHFLDKIKQEISAKKKP
jgi:hypothetical protein